MRGMEEKQIDKVLKPSKILLIITIIAAIVTLGVIGAAFYLNYKDKQDPKDLGTLITNYEDKEGEYAKLHITTVPYGFAEEDENNGGKRISI